MGRHRVQRPSLDELAKFPDKKSAAIFYDVSVRTITRWLGDSYHPKKNYGANKLTMEQAKEIRHLHANGCQIKALAKQYGVTFSSISRVIHNITHKEKSDDTSLVSVIYNIK